MRTQKVSIKGSVRDNNKYVQDMCDQISYNFCRINDTHSTLVETESTIERFGFHNQDTTSITDAMSSLDAQLSSRIKSIICSLKSVLDESNSVREILDDDAT